MAGNNFQERLLLGILNNYTGLMTGENEIIPQWELVGYQPPLESAYQSILSEREEPLVPLPSTTPLSEEDLLCNTNLQTSILFKKLSGKSKFILKDLENTNDTKKSLDESRVKLEKSLQNIRDICVDQPENEELNKTYLPFINSINTVIKEKTCALDLRRDELEKEKDTVNKKLNTLRGLITTGIQDMINPEDVQKKMCPVCFEREVNMVLVPCGHTYCKGCLDLDNSKNAKCAQCRSIINARVKIFFTV